MRLFPLITAALVTAFLYFLVVERDRLLAFAGNTPEEMSVSEDGVDHNLNSAESAQADMAKGIRVSVLRSKAQIVDDAVLLRGRTEAFRQLDVRAETSGKIVSEALRKGSFVTEGEVLCSIEEGTRGATLAEAQARLKEAEARVPESKARVPEAEARVIEAEARVEEAKARLDEANINANAANKLSGSGYASDTRVASAEAGVRGAMAAVVSAQAGLKSARSGLETVAAGIEAASAGVESARAAVAMAEREISRLTIVAPFDGLLESDTVEIGSLVQPGGHCATIIQLNPIRVVGYVPEFDVDRVTQGAAANVLLTSNDHQSGLVTFVSRSADPSTRTFRVEVEVQNPDMNIRDGQTAQMLIASDGAEAHLLPQSALTLGDGGDLGVRVVNDESTVEFHPVKVLRDTVDGVWLTGLGATADVIVVGQEFVTEGVRVDPVFDTQEDQG